jgi:hypothetical protein
MIGAFVWGLAAGAFLEWAIVDFFYTRKLTRERRRFQRLYREIGFNPDYPNDWPRPGDTEKPDE